MFGDEHTCAKFGVTTALQRLRPLCLAV
ncbi:unnamed protein product [Ectocarpus sp. CCAP 1310/34]|nr:unnamed protein product [Ectocarpus sp. CCAP 1310/34]